MRNILNNVTIIEKGRIWIILNNGYKYIRYLPENFNLNWSLAFLSNNAYLNKFKILRIIGKKIL